MKIITFIPFEIFLIIFGKSIYHVKVICHVQNWSLYLAFCSIYHP